MKRSDEYQRYANSMREFIAAYEDLAKAVDSAYPEDGYGLSIFSALDYLPENRLDLMTRVAEASGKARDASIQSGLGMLAIGGLPFNPVMDWRMSFEGAGVTRDVVLTNARQIAALWESRAEDARRGESGLVGVVARFVRFPSDVREAAGLTSKAGRTSAFVVAMAVQVLGGALAVGLAALVVYVVTAVFSR